MSSVSVWIPEHPRLPAWRARQPAQTGKLGEITNLLTFDAAHALHFDTREECEAWIAANPDPVFVARDHMFIDDRGAG